MSTFMNTEAPQPQGHKLFSPACERNKEPILTVLTETLAAASTVLEVASGTGQHAVYFGQHMPHLSWLTSDLQVNHASIRAWIEESGLANVRVPVVLDVDDAPWSLRDAGLPVANVDAIYSSNMLHIVSWPQVNQFFNGLSRLLKSGGALCIYGPFRYKGEFSSEGDARFDQILKEQNATSGIRDFEAVDALAVAEGLRLEKDVPMPANNHLLIWRKGV